MRALETERENALFRDPLAQAFATAGGLWPSSPPPDDEAARRRRLAVSFSIVIRTKDHGHQPGYAPSRFTTAHTLMAFLDTDRTPPRTRIVESLSHPRLTGMSRTELDALARRLAPRQVAQVERASYQRRGADRQPGSRGGVFPQKLGDRERIVVAIRYLRKLCTLDVLADVLGDVSSRSSIGNAVREIRPLLAEGGLLRPPTTTRYRTATELLAVADEETDTPTS
ncbi:hypothetical protein [Streptomyces sp. NBC_01003]|uniref:hypothetical protein n=1 Tax=Streptomyces sp. NBC_01003 TaxID=2903714 RepID=UPI0038695EE5